MSTNFEEKIAGVVITLDRLGLPVAQHMIDDFRETFEAEGEEAPRVAPEVRAKVLAMINRMQEQCNRIDQEQANAQPLT